MKRKLAIGCLAPVLVALIAAGVFAYRQHRYYDRVVAEAQAMGLPTSVADLEAMYPMPPDEENAAVRYREAFQQRAAIDADQTPEERAAYRKLHIVGEADPPPGAVWHADYLALANAYVADHADMLETLHEVSALPGCRFWRFREPTPTADHVDYISEMPQLARIAAFSADVAARSGRHNDAVHAIETLAAMSRHLTMQPSRFDATVADPNSAGTLYWAERIVLGGGLSGAQLAAIEEAIASMDDPGAVARAISSEMAGMLADSRDAEPFVATGDGTLAGEFPRTVRSLIWLASPIIKGMTAGMVEWYIPFIAAAQKPMPASLDAIDIFQRNFASSSMGKLLAGSNIPSLARFYQSYAETAGRIRVVAALCAVERYRVAEGKIPMNVDDLVPAYLPAVPIDPFDGKPLRYSLHPDGGGYLLYSIGYNRMDDNGGGDDIAIDTSAAP